MRILFAESDPFLASIHEPYFTQAGFEVIHAATGERLLALAQEEEIHAIVMGLALPKKDGLEVLAEFARLNIPKNIPIIVYSRVGAKEMIDRCFQYGICQYLVKAHHTPEELIETVKHHVGR